MTLIIVTVLAAAWLGYFALWFREKRAARVRPVGGMISFSGSPQAAARAVGSAASIADGARHLGERHLGDLLELPRTRQQALRRRRQVAAVLVSAAVVSLLAVPVLGSFALTVHVLADVGLLLFAVGSMRRQQPPELAEVRVLYPGRPAPGEGLVPLRQVVNG